MDFISTDIFDTAAQLSGKVYYIRTDQEIVDFTIPFHGNLLVSSSDGINLSIPFKEEKSFFIAMHDILFNEDKCVIVWNIKNLISYCKFFYTEKFALIFPAKLFDLQLAEAYLAITSGPPHNYMEAKARLDNLVKNKKVITIARTIHEPLFRKVIPTIETNKLVGDRRDGKVKYSSYQIEGQLNGRLCCHKAFTNCLNPHVLMPEDRKNLFPRFDKQFIGFDYSHMEVSILQCLSNDPMLNEIAEKDEDYYQSIYKSIYKEECDNLQKRSFIKSVFLPIVFGAQAQRVSQQLSISFTQAEDIVVKLRTNFAKAFEWVDAYQEQLKKSIVVEDYFGRVRIFSEKKWAVRCFVIQSPAAICCLEKLIELDKKLSGKIAFYIHDAYFLVCDDREKEDVCLTANHVLSSPSKLMPGLKLKIRAQIGTNLSNLSKLPLR